MKLDPRIIEGKKPLTCFDTEIAKQFIGKECYFSSELVDFGEEDLDPKSYKYIIKNLSEYNYITKDVLKDVSSTGEKPFLSGSTGKWEFMLPLEWVKQEEHWRPYTFEEFLARFQVGERIRYRKKDNPDYEIIEVLSVMRISQKHSEISVRLSCGDYDLQGLFDTFEIFDCESSNADFTPFGVKE